MIRSIKSVRLENRGRLRRRGAEVLEAALVLPIVLSLTFGAVEFGYFFFLQHNLQAAAREGARAGAVYGATDADATAKATAFLQNASLDASKFTISVGHPGSNISVTVQSTWGNAGIKLLFIANNKIVRGAAVMRREG